MCWWRRASQDNENGKNIPGGSSETRNHLGEYTHCYLSPGSVTAAKDQLSCSLNSPHSNIWAQLVPLCLICPNTSFIPSTYLSTYRDLFPKGFVPWGLPLVWKWFYCLLFPLGISSYGVYLIISSYLCINYVRAICFIQLDGSVLGKISHFWPQFTSVARL